MAGIGKTIKKRFNDLKKNPLRALHPVESIGNSVTDIVDDVGGAMTPEIPIPEEQPLIPIPDESKAALEAKRRRAKKVGTGRSSTILTQGLGG